MFRFLSAALLGAILASPAAAEDLKFLLSNTTSEAVTEFYASPSNTDEWGEDILGQDVLNAGEDATVTIADGSDQCEYDLRFLFVGGEQVTEEAIDLCETGSYTLSE